MTMTMRVSLPGYDALSDGTIDHYSLYADTDNILIKERSRGVGTVSSGNSGTVTHSLGYVPLFLVYSEISSGRYRVSNSYNPAFDTSGWRSYAGTGNLIIENSYGTSGSVVKYYIFHDNVGSTI